MGYYLRFFDSIRTEYRERLPGPGQSVGEEYNGVSGQEIRLYFSTYRMEHLGSRFTGTCVMVRARYKECLFRGGRDDGRWSVLQTNRAAVSRGSEKA